MLNSNASSVLAKLKSKKLALIAGFAIPLFLFGKLYFNGPVCKIKKDLKNTHILITGCNTGIGKETALQLAKMGAHIIMACRDPLKTLPILFEIKSQSQNPNITFLKLDLSDLNSVHESASELREIVPKIDIIILNAGVMMKNYETNNQGLEKTFVTNYLGHFLLTLELLDLIKKSNEGRIIVVSAGLHKFGSINFDNINLTQSYSFFRAYNQSKLASVMFAAELNDRLQNSGVSNVKAISLHPGVIMTDLSKDVKNIILTILMYLPMRYITKSCFHGAQTTLYCALCDFQSLKGGQYYMDNKVAKMSKKAEDKEAKKKLWELSEDLIGLKSKNINCNIQFQISGCREKNK